MPAYLIRATILGVMAQRLVRILCPHCRQSCDIDQGVWEQLVQPWNEPAPASVCQAVGCEECRNAGYLGRQGIYEILPMSEELHQQIQVNPDISLLRRAGVSSGMKTLRYSGARKVAEGLTTVEEVMRVTPAIE